MPSIWSGLVIQVVSALLRNNWQDFYWHAASRGPSAIAELLVFNCNHHFANYETITVSQCCLIKLLPYILFEKYIYILALKMASPGNQHCANCIGTLSFPINQRPTGVRRKTATRHQCWIRWAVRIFTARCYASAVLAMVLCLSVRLSLRPSQVGVLLKRLNVGSHKQNHTIT